MLAISLYIFSSLLIVSLVSFVGALTLAINPDKLKRATIFLVGLSAGTLLGDAFLHLLPETIKNDGRSLAVWLYLLGGVILFFVLEKIIQWRHCHIPTSENHPHPLGKMNLIGDGLHNFLDGIIIAGSFLVSIPIGIATTIAVIAHEIPQEISDFGVLIHAGYSRNKALLFNFFSALAAILGGGLGLILGAQSENFAIAIIPLAAGGFVYIATADLIPELQKDTRPLKSAVQLISILAGIGIMLLLKMF